MCLSRWRLKAEALGIASIDLFSSICERIREKGPLCAKHEFFGTFQAVTLQTTRALGWFVSRSDLLNKFNIRASCPKHWTLEVRHKTASFERDWVVWSPRPHHIWVGHKIYSKCWLIIEECCSKFEVHSYYSSKVKQFSENAKWALSQICSPVTNTGCDVSQMHFPGVTVGTYGKHN